jgi:hypothetical protein
MSALIGFMLHQFEHARLYLLNMYCSIYLCSSMHFAQCVPNLQLAKQITGKKYYVP